MTAPTGTAVTTLRTGPLESRLRRQRDAGSPLLLPYLTAGVTADWLDHARAYADAGADAIEIGLPFSDPMLDGTAVQRACQRALERGTTPRTAIAQAAGLALGVPLVAMTYSNVVLRHGPAEFCDRLRDAGFAGLIVVDAPHGEAGPLAGIAAERDLDLVLMVAPSTPEPQVARIAELGRGFVYAATVMGTTGGRTGVPQPAVDLAARVRARTTLPVVLGFGISTPAEAARAAAVADGIAVGSALMRRVLAGAGPAEVADDVRHLRLALNS